MKRRNAVVLTALPVEYKAARRHLNDITEIVHPSGTIYETGGFVGSNGDNWQVELAEIGAGNPSAAAEAERAIAYFDPEVVLFVGVAGGLKDVDIGDVVAGTKVYGYESGKAAREFQIRTAVFNSSYDLQQRARAEAKREDWLERTDKTSAATFRVFVAPIAAGEKVISSRKSTIHKFLSDNFGDALAVEMEGRGFLEATHANQQVRALVVRGISDLIDQKAESDSQGSQDLAASNACAFAFEVLAKFSLQANTHEGYVGTTEHDAQSLESNSLTFEPNDEIKSLIENIKLGDWDTSADVAIQVISKTKPDGTSPTFRALLKYYSCPTEDLKWAATQVVESTLAISPDLLSRDILVHLATHPDFSLRASAASICMELANLDPSRVPLDILIPLSRHDEDWYVQAPANAALKTMLSSMPTIYRIFCARLDSTDPNEREHAATMLADIAKTEPWLLEAKELRTRIRKLRASGDQAAANILMAILPRVAGASRKNRYRYGL
jgi:nucleoside phosphorylase